MRRASIITVLCLVTALAQAQTTASRTVEIKWNEEQPGVIVDYSKPKAVKRTHLRGDSIPFTGTILFTDSRGMRDKEEHFINGVRDGRQIIRYYETGEPHKAWVYLNGKNIALLRFEKSGAVADSTINDPN